jgi:hypothetical protein
LELLPIEKRITPRNHKFGFGTGTVDVGFSPDSGAIADVAKLRRRANRRREMKEAAN